MQNEWEKAKNNELHESLQQLKTVWDWCLENQHEHLDLQDYNTMMKDVDKFAFKNHPVPHTPEALFSYLYFWTMQQPHAVINQGLTASAPPKVRKAARIIAQFTVQGMKVPSLEHLNKTYYVQFPLTLWSGRVRMTQNDISQMESLEKHNHLFILESIVSASVDPGTAQFFIRICPERTGPLVLLQILVPVECISDLRIPDPTLHDIEKSEMEVVVIPGTIMQIESIVTGTEGKVTEVKLQVVPRTASRPKKLPGVHMGAAASRSTPSVCLRCGLRIG